MGSAGYVNLFFDGKLLIENDKSYLPGELFFMMGSTEKRVVVRNLVKGRSYAIEARGKFRWRAGLLTIPYGIRLGANRIVDAQEQLDAAAELASTSDLAIVVVGLTGEIETEGYDRKNIECVPLISLSDPDLSCSLPGHQNALVETVLSANRNTIIITQSGMPVQMPWVNKAHTLVQSFYGGNEVGNGIADVLFGKVNPSGRLPVSFP